MNPFTNPGKAAECEQVGHRWDFADRFAPVRCSECGTTAREQHVEVPRLTQMYQQATGQA